MQKFVLNKLKGRIVEVLGTNDKFMELMGFSKPTMYAKLAGTQGFTQDEIYKASEILHIKPEEIYLYFFTKVNEFEQ